MIRALRSHGSPGGHVESLYRDHAAEVYRYALAMLGSPADAEDATQATFLNAFRAIERGDAPRQPGAWLRAIVHNLCLQQFRQSARRPHQVALDDEADEFFADPGTPTIEDVIRALKLVPFNQRAALVMREFEGRPLTEIAEALAVTPAAVETLLFRARRSLREQLEESLTCAEAELAISRQLDGLLARAERSALRAHLRQCEACARHARSLRAQRKSMQSLAVLPLPAALAWWHGGGASGRAGMTAAAGAAGAAPAGISLIVKVAAVVLTTGAVGGLGYVGVNQGIIGAPSAPPATAVAHSAPPLVDRPAAATVAALGHPSQGHGTVVGLTIPAISERRPPAPLSLAAPGDAPDALQPAGGLGDPLESLTDPGPAPDAPAATDGAGDLSTAGSTETSTADSNPGGNGQNNPGGGQSNPGTGGPGNPGGNPSANGSGNAGGGQGNPDGGQPGNPGGTGSGNPGGGGQANAGGNGSPNPGGGGQGNDGGNGQGNPAGNAGGPPLIHGRTDAPGSSGTNGHAVPGEPGGSGNAGANPGNAGANAGADPGNSGAAGNAIAGGPNPTPGGANPNAGGANPSPGQVSTVPTTPATATWN